MVISGVLDVCGWGRQPHSAHLNHPVNPEPNIVFELTALRYVRLVCTFFCLVGVFAYPGIT